jgi:hypothetical protein
MAAVCYEYPDQSHHCSYQDEPDERDQRSPYGGRRGAHLGLRLRGRRSDAELVRHPHLGVDHVHHGVDQREV